MPDRGFHTRPHCQPPDQSDRGPDQGGDDADHDPVGQHDQTEVSFAGTDCAEQPELA